MITPTSTVVRTQLNLTSSQLTDLLNTLTNPPNTLVNYTGFSLPSGQTISNIQNINIMVNQQSGTAVMNIVSV